MADTKQTKASLAKAASVIREEDLNDLEKFEEDLQGRVDAAREDGRAFMMATYVCILADIKGKTARIRARFNREVLANMRREEKEVRLAEKVAREKAEAEGEKSAEK